MGLSLATVAGPQVQNTHITHTPQTHTHGEGKLFNLSKDMRFSCLFFLVGIKNIITFVIMAELLPAKI